MKWNHLTVAQKVIFAIGCICGLAYIVLSFPALRSDLTIPEALLTFLYGNFWLCMAILAKGKMFAIIHYILAAMFYLHSLLHLFF